MIPDSLASGGDLRPARPGTDVLFGQAYYLRFDPKLQAALEPYPPLGTLYAAAVAREAGYRVGLFDAMLAGSESEWDLALASYEPRFAILYEDSFNYLSKMCLLRMREAAGTMIRMATARGAAVIVAGSDATDHPEFYLEAGARFIIRGEAEVTLVELLDTLTGRPGRSPAEIPGLCYYADRSDPEGRTGQPPRHLVRTPPRPLVRDLDGLPLPAWDLVDVSRYRTLWRTRHGHHSMNLVTTRGCPYHCNWCAKPIYGQNYTVRSPENVVSEMVWLKRHHDPDHFAFADDIFGLKPGWIERFAAEVERQNVVTPFKCLLRPDLVTDTVVAALWRAGCRTVWMGAESGSQKILDAMDKGTTVDQIREAAERLHAAGIKVGFFLQFGYPGESRSDIEATIRMVRNSRPDDIGISVSYPLPGTPFHDRVRTGLRERQNWTDSSDLALLHQGPFPTEFYRMLHRVIHKEFQIRKVGRDLARSAWRLSGWRRSHARKALGLLYRAATLPIDRVRLERLARAPRSCIAVSASSAGK